MSAKNVETAFENATEIVIQHASSRRETRARHHSQWGDDRGLCYEYRR